MAKINVKVNEAFPGNTSATKMSVPCSLVPNIE
jgi:hypothetical protein